MKEQLVKLDSKDKYTAHSKAKAHNPPEKFVQLNNFNDPIIRRKAPCACGGGCPTCQAKNSNLPISQPHDVSEIEADAIADKVMQRGESVNASSSQSEEKLHRKKSADNSSLSAPSIVRDALSSSGKPMDARARTFMESRFNQDFGGVKIHDGDLAAKSASSINALAYTAGSDIVFNSGQYDPGSDSGKKLLAHELAHVVQQEKTSKTIQRKPTLIESDIEQITSQVRNAIDRVGTDEEAVYTALQRLEKDGDAIKAADALYSQKYGTTLEDDIRGDFSEEELQYALELIGITPYVASEFIQSAPSNASDYDIYAKKLYNAMDMVGTNEEAIYGVLIAMENVPERIEKLKTAYTDRYPKGLHGGDLEYDLRDEMSDEELDYALLLLNAVPQGNTAILDWIKGLIGSVVKREAAAEVMKSLNKITNDRLTVIIVNLIRDSKIDGFKNNLVSVVAGDFPALVARIDSVEAQFKDPSIGTTAATAGQKKQITGILNQGMKVNEETGEIDTFKDPVDGRTYDQDIQETVDKEVTALTDRADDRAKLPKFDWPRYDEMANEAKKRTDAVFGHYTTGSVLSSTPGPGRNLFDFSEKAFSDAELLQFADYLVTGHNAKKPIYPDKTIHEAHTADVSRKSIKGKIGTALGTWVGLPGNKARLLKVLQNWSGAQQGGNIFMQRWDVGNVNKNREQFWKMFQTMIHEYLHKITNPDYSAKAKALGRVKEQVYTEGGTSYFDERVWTTIYPEEVRANAKLREKVEGGVYDYDSGLIPTNDGYDQIDQFKQIVKVVGEANAAAAYFLGKTDLIGL